MLLRRFKLLPPSLDGVLGAGERAQDCWHVRKIANFETHIAGMTGCSRPDIGVAQRVRDRAIPAGSPSILSLRAWLSIVMRLTQPIDPKNLRMHPAPSLLILLSDID